MKEEKLRSRRDFASAKLSEAKRTSTRSSYKEHTENALASGDEEGRDKLRKATGRSKYPIIRGYPNGETHYSNTVVLYTE